MKGRYPALLDDKAQGPAARQLWDDAQAMLREVLQKNWFRPKAVIGFWPANTVGDDIKLFTDDARSEDLAVLYTLRQQLSKQRTSRTWPSRTSSRRLERRITSGLSS